MCGIAGIFDLKSERQINESVLVNMRDSLIHRGPDEAGVYITPGVGFAHRRLSIIDLSSGKQPLSNPDKTVTICFNGEIFNYPDLTEELKDLGYQFTTSSDTETILHAWEEWGAECVHHLRGMFAFSIWDRKTNTLFLARDRLGVKPLLYAFTDDGYLIFASEHKALFNFPGLSRKIKTKSVETYFALGYITEPDTIYQSINKLPAGYTLTITDKQQPVFNQYWDIPFKSVGILNQQQAEQELVARLKEAIDIRMIAEVPLGAFLSGGVDSSSVVALMASLQDTPVNTCSIGFNDPQYNESDYADKVAHQYKTNHHKEIVDSDDYDLIDTLVEIYDEPYADSSALPTYQVCKLARKHVTVALSGDGADELMSGYRRHQFHLKEEKLRTLLPLSIRKPVFGLLAKIYPKADWAPQFLRAKTTFQALSKDSVNAYFNTVSQNTDETRQKLFSNNFKTALSGFNAVDIFNSHAEKAPSKDSQSLIQYLDLKTYLIDDILTKVDRASMAHALEVRTPLLDHKWVEWMSGVENKYKDDGKTGKSLLKKSMEKYLENDILYRKKMGFSIPLASWFRGPLKERVKEVLEGSRLTDTGWFNMPFLKQVNLEHQKKYKDHSVLIWSLIMFDGFLRKEERAVESEQ